MTRIAVIDPQPAIRAGLAVLLRAEPGLVPVGAAAGQPDGLEMLARVRPHVAVIEHRLADGDGLSLMRRLGDLPSPPRTLLYTLDPEPGLVLAARVAGYDGVVDKEALPDALFDALRRVARGGTALPPLSAAEFDAAAHRVEPDDLALLAMLVDRTPRADVAATLRLDPRRLGRRIERLLGRLRSRSTTGVTA